MDRLHTCSVTPLRGDVYFTSPSQQASDIDGLRVTIPSEDMVPGSTYAFELLVDTELGGTAKAEVEVYKSSRVLLNSKVLSMCQRRCERLPLVSDIGDMMLLATERTS